MNWMLTKFSPEQEKKSTPSKYPGKAKARSWAGKGRGRNPSESAKDTNDTTVNDKIHIITLLTLPMLMAQKHT